MIVLANETEQYWYRGQSHHLIWEDRTELVIRCQGWTTQAYRDLGSLISSGERYKSWSTSAGNEREIDGDSWRVTEVRLRPRHIFLFSLMHQARSSWNNFQINPSLGALNLFLSSDEKSDHLTFYWRKKARSWCRGVQGRGLAIILSGERDPTQPSPV